jgi:hypothetical protein
VVVYSADSISGLFNGASTTFDLKIGGIPIPSGQLSTESVFVSLGAVTLTPVSAYSISGNRIVFTNPPPAGMACDVRIVTSEDGEETLKIYSFTLAPAFDDVTTIFTATTGDGPTNGVPITENNTFVFLGGVEQLPTSAYAISRISSSTIQISFTGAPPANTNCDVRAIGAGPLWANRGPSPVEVYSLDDISVFFNGVLKTFTLRAGGSPVNPAVVNTQNIFVSLGGAMQLPSAAYTVTGDQITFTEAPLFGTTSNLRIVTNSEYLTCPQVNGFGEFLRWGPGLILNAANEMEILDSGLIP